MSDDLKLLFQSALDRAFAQRWTPTATYRVQFHAGFTFRDAAAIVPYLADLGISHLYASPYLAAVEGSTHGYDVIDPSRLNPELGTMADYEALLATLRKHGMSHILDTVPNHAGVATNDNPWWNDVLKHGPSSEFGAFFDIDWAGSPRSQLHNKVLLPVLGDTYGAVLEKGELTLVQVDDAAFVQYHERRFPLAPGTLEDAADTYIGTPGDAASWERLDALLERQHYRLAYWRTAPDEINYRRFFDINDLAALAMERPEVFEASHAFILPRLARGDIGGLRIDHPDGLLDPARYFLRLQQHYLLAIAREMVDDETTWQSLRTPLLRYIEQHVTDVQSVGGTWPLYVTVEKILAPGEALPTSWAVDGTSGYDFLNMVNGLFIDAAGEQELTDFYRQWTGEQATFQEIAYLQKKRILDTSLASDLHRLAQTLDSLAQRDRHSRDFTLGGITAALREVIACFAVYRTYIDTAGVSDIDKQRIAAAIDLAQEKNPALDDQLLDFVRDTLLLRFGDRFTDDDRADQVHFAGKFQQLTAPATAKGVEDTAFYLYNRLLSLNEVGGEPGQFGVMPAELHCYFAQRQREWPNALSVLSTHDTKRSADVRARLNVLSEMPREWREHVTRWGEFNEACRAMIDGQPVPDRNDEYAIYQTIIGIWPRDNVPSEAWVERIKQWTTKATREAKRHTSWTDPTENYEAGVHGFIEQIFRDPSGKFLEDLRPFAERVHQLGWINSLAQSLLKLLAPGVPDTYQGTEQAVFSLVDPDNRTPVDYGMSAQALGSTDVTADDEHAKLLVHRRALDLRRRYPELAARGEYLPLDLFGDESERYFAFARRLADVVAIVVVPRLHHPQTTSPIHPESISLNLASLTVQGPLYNWFDDDERPVTVSAQGGIKVTKLLTPFPVALLINAPVADVGPRPSTMY